MDEHGNPVVKAFLRVSNRTIGFKTTSRGEYWRILRPGRYTLEVSAPGFHTAKQDFIVLEQQISILNVTLKSLHEEPEEPEQLQPEQNTAQSAVPPPTVAPQENKLDAIRQILPEPLLPARFYFNGFKSLPLPNNDPFEFAQPLRH